MYCHSSIACNYCYSAFGNLEARTANEKEIIFESKQKSVACLRVIYLNVNASFIYIYDIQKNLFILYVYSYLF